MGLLVRITCCNGLADKGKKSKKKKRDWLVNLLEVGRETGSDVAAALVDSLSKRQPFKYSRADIILEIPEPPMLNYKEN